MPSVSPWTLTYDFAADASAANYVNAAALQAQLESLASDLADLYTALGVPIRADDTLSDALVRIRNLHPEVSTYLTGTVLSSVLPFLADVDVASVGSDLTLEDEQTIDGVLTSASRILVKDQTDAKQNGIYDTAAGPWTRVTDLPEDTVVAASFAVNCVGGTLNTGKVFAALVGNTAVAVGADDLGFFDMFPSWVGPTGADGADGATILSGTAAPTTEGADGDFYLRTTTSMFYGPKASGVWPSGVSLIGATGAKGDDGADGADGATVLNGIVTPVGTSLGVDGDFYINTALNLIHGPKAAGVWPAGVAMVGPTGATGPAGGSDYSPFRFTAASGTWTVPATPTGSNLWMVDAVGGGGGGGGSAVGTLAGGGGGKGFRVRAFVTLAAGASIAYGVGAGGTAGASLGDGGDGSSTTFGSVTAAGGVKGVTGAGSTAGAPGHGDPPGSGAYGGGNPTVSSAGASATGQGGGGAATGGTVGFAGGSGALVVQLVANV